MKFKKGDLVSAEPALFDGDVPGSYSNDHPERCVWKGGIP
jgi:hypothetical protein